MISPKLLQFPSLLIMLFCDPIDATQPKQHFDVHAERLGTV